MNSVLKTWLRVTGALLLADVAALLVWPGMGEGYESSIQRAIPLIAIGLFLLGSFASTLIFWFLSNRGQSKKSST